MNLQECKQALDSLLTTDIYLRENGSQLMSKARGANRNECITAFGGLAKIQKYVSEFKPGEVHTAAPVNTGEQLPILKTGAVASTSTSRIPAIPASFSQIGRNVLRILVGIIGVVILRKLTQYLMAFFYDVFNANRIVYLKVLLPRGDTKIEREREKEIAKDMKEKISRISQVYDNIHKLGDISFYDNIMLKYFHKPKVTFIMHYENGLVHFIIGVYPEYRKLIEGAISAQYSEASIELIEKPQFFSKKYYDLTVLEPNKDQVYPIKIFKQMQDDPLNNIVDGMGKVSSQDTFTVLMAVKPNVSDAFNKRAKRFADALYKKDKSIVEQTAWWKYIVFPWKILDFLISGPSKELLEATKGDEKEGGFVRMVKAQEDAINVMAEEAGKHSFLSSLILISSSDNEKSAEDNINNMIGSFTIFRDEYNNELDENNVYGDVLGFFFKPLWKFAVQFQLPTFFFKPNVFTPNALGSLFHFPDGVYNRAPIIKRLDYKVLAGPDNAVVPKEETGFVMTGILAEEYKKGSLAEILKDMSYHKAVGEKEEEVEEMIELDKATSEQRSMGQTVQKDGKAYVKITKKVKKLGFKIYKDATFLGVNVYRNQFTPIYMKKNDRTRHHYIIGKSGGGKSVYIGALARQDVWVGNGVCVIDPHGDLVEDVLQYIPKERAKDVIYFDAGNEDRPMGLNLYEIDNIDQADRVVNDATEIFLKMFGPEIFGPRIQEYFKYGSLTLLEDFEDRPTLLDVPRLFTDETYREFKVAKVKNAVVRNFWEKTYNAMGDREKQEIIPYFTSKFVSFNTNRLIRNIIGQTKSGFRFREAMDSGKILLVNLSKGKIGEINAQLLGMILVSQIYNAAMSRANVPEEERRDFYLYVDEFQNFVSGTFADILSEARKYRLSLIMAHQYIAQLEAGKGLGDTGGGKNDVKAAVFGNVGTMQSFKVGAPDAEFLEKEYSPVLSAQDIVGIANYKAYIKLNINNSTSRVFSMDTVWTQDYRSKKIAPILKEYSAKKYGRAREYVDAEIIARLGLSAEEPAAAEGDVAPATEGAAAPEATAE